MGKQQSKRDQQCMLMSGKINRSLQEQINKKKTGFNLTNYNLHTSVSEFSICCFDSSNKAIEIPLKVELPPQPLPSQKMPDGNTNSHSVLLNSQVLNCAETFSKSTNSAGDTNDDNCNKIEPFECELQVDTSSEKKQDWSFTLYDFDGRGKITKEELASLFQALYDAVGSSIRLPLNGTKKLKLRLSIGHDRSHLDRNPKDQSPPLVKKKAKLKNSSRLVEWKGVSLQPVDTGAHQALVEPSKECPKLNNLDGSPRAKASTVTKLENQLSPTTPGIGHRLTLSCKEQEKLTEMVHENMVRNQVRQQTGRKNHHSAHRHHHHHHREARRHRVPRRQGDENRKPRERERTYYLDLGSIGHTGSQNPVAPGTTATATVTTSVMTFTRAPLIDVAPSSSSPPPPPPPTASGSTAHCNEIGMVAEDDDGEVVPETGPPGSRLKYGNNKSNIGANNPGTWGKSRQGEGVNLMAPTTAPGTADQPDPHHCRRQHHPHHNHHHHHNHRRRSHPLRGSGDVGHTRCKHCNEQCSPVSFDVVKSGINGSQTVNKDQKREFAHRRYKNNNSNHNNKINHNNNNDNNNNNNNDNNNNNNNNNLKDVTNQTTTVHELSPASEGGDPSKQGPSHPPFKCQIAEGNLKSGADCECSRYQKALCRQRVSNTGSLNIKSDNQPMPRHRNTEGQELTTRMNINPQINTGSVGVAAAPPTPQAVAVTISHPPVEKKSSERLLKQSVTERHKKHNEGHHFSQAGRITTQECGGQTVPTPGLKILTPRGTIGAVAERKTLRTHHKAECSSHCVSSRHKPHWPANTTVPDKPMSNTQLALLPTQTSPAPPALNPTANGGPSNADAAAPASTASDTITNTITNNNNNNNDNNNKDNSASTLTLQEPQHHHHHHHHLRRRNQSVRNLEFSEAMQQVADWINREHNVPQKEHAQPNAVPRASADAENFVHVQRHEHHHVHEYHHHHHYHHYYQA